MNIRNIHDFETIITLVTPIVLARQAKQCPEIRYAHIDRGNPSISVDQLTKIFKAYVTIPQGCAFPNKLAAIRTVREFLGLCLRDAKDVVEGNYQG